MTPPDDLSPPRRPIFLPVVIATVFLTIIFMTVGFTLGERHKRDDAQADPVPTPSTAPVSTFQPPGPLCPQATLDTASRLGFGQVWQKLKVETSRTRVWICENDRGQLFYQGQTGPLGDSLVEGTNGLFLYGVNQVSDDRYEVTDQKGNVFRVTRKQFELDKVGAQPDIQNVVKSE